MPRGDGTGPAGMGPMTGRAAGYCAGYSVPGFANPYGGRYFGAGMGAFGGRGRGYRNWYYATGVPGWQRFGAGFPAWGGMAGYGNPYMQGFSPDQEVKILKDQADILKKQLDDIQARIEEVQQEAEKKEE
ncbi:MAG: DUF5320 domain-containing protein [Actinobacteria bacterium]|nr:DUF5320 domain-containing protein [Actinomycetota bacterium]